MLPNENLKNLSPKYGQKKNRNYANVSYHLETNHKISRQTITIQEVQSSENNCLSELV